MASDVQTWRLNDKRWLAEVSGQSGSLYVSLPWWQALEAEYGFVPQLAVVTNDDGSIRSALPWVLVSDARGERLRSLPFSDMVAGPLKPQDWNALFASVGDADLPAQVWTLNDGPEREGWAKQQLCVWQYISVDDEADGLLARCGASTRNRIRVSRREGFEVFFDTSAVAIDDFFDLHLAVRRDRHRLLAQGRSLFHHQREAFGERLGVLRVRRDGQTEAAAIVIEHDGVLYYKYSASRPDYRSRGVNQRLVFGVSELAVDRGMTRVDLGRSDVDQPGLVKFKQSLGATDEPLYRYDRAGLVSPAAADLGVVLGQLTELFVDESVSDLVAENAGAALYRFFA